MLTHPSRHALRYHAVLGTIDLVIVAMAMVSFSAGIGVMIGITTARIIFAVRAHRHERRRAREREAESRRLDERLAAALAARRPVIDVVDEDLS